MYICFALARVNARTMSTTVRSGGEDWPFWHSHHFWVFPWTEYPLKVEAWDVRASFLGMLCAGGGCWDDIFQKPTKHSGICQMQAPLSSEGSFKNSHPFCGYNTFRGTLEVTMTVKVMAYFPVPTFFFPCFLLALESMYNVTKVPCVFWSQWVKR